MRQIHKIRGMLADKPYEQKERVTEYKEGNTGWSVILNQMARESQEYWFQLSPAQELPGQKKGACCAGSKESGDDNAEVTSQPKLNKWRE